VCSNVSEESGTCVFRVAESGSHGCRNHLDSLIYTKMEAARFFEMSELTVITDGVTTQNC